MMQSPIDPEGSSSEDLVGPSLLLPREMLPSFPEGWNKHTTRKVLYVWVSLYGFSRKRFGPEID